MHNFIPLLIAIMIPSISWGSCKFPDGDSWYQYDLIFEGDVVREKEIKWTEGKIVERRYLYSFDVENIWKGDKDWASKVTTFIAPRNTTHHMPSFTNRLSRKETHIVFAKKDGRHYFLSECSGWYSSLDKDRDFPITQRLDDIVALTPAQRELGSSSSKAALVSVKRDTSGGYDPEGHTFVVTIDSGKNSGYYAGLELFPPMYCPKSGFCEDPSLVLISVSDESSVGYYHYYDYSKADKLKPYVGLEVVRNPPRP